MADDGVIKDGCRPAASVTRGRHGEIGRRLFFCLTRIIIWRESSSDTFRDVARVKVVTEGGTLLGQVANVYVHLSPPPLVADEVRESLLDSLSLHLKGASAPAESVRG
jgi:hypothetical protein